MKKPYEAAACATGRSRLDDAWRAARRVLQGLPFTSLHDCASQLASIPWLAPEGNAVAYLADRMAELVRDRDDSGDSLWNLFRNAVGFPVGGASRLLELSCPPAVTFGPNPWIDQLLSSSSDCLEVGKEATHSEMPGFIPFAADVSEGKGHAIYNAHSYHTKVPHRAIMRYILHYTEPGDVVFDGFCGTGMTGVAAALCGDRTEVEALGYRVSEEGRLEVDGAADLESRTLLDASKTVSVGRLGTRRAILMDLSPAASLIAAAYNSPHDASAFRREAESILRQLDDSFGWMYGTCHIESDSACQEKPSSDLTANYARRLLECRTWNECRAVATEWQSRQSVGQVRMVAWSDVFCCPRCDDEFVFADLAVDPKTGKVAKEFVCRECGARLVKRDLRLAWHEQPGNGPDEHSTRSAKSVPVWIHYEHEGKRYRKRPDAWDLALIEASNRLPIAEWFPSDRLFAGRETRRNDRRGMTHVHHFYSRRNLRFLAALRSACTNRHDLLLWFTSQLVNLSKLNRYRPDVTFPYNPLSGTLYVGSLVAESNPLIAYRHKIDKISKALSQVQAENIVVCGSLSSALLPDESVDYIFTDPPFGGNLAYSELNVLWESWLDVRTRRCEEAIETRMQGKSRDDYAHLMKWCFRQYYRVLKRGKWMTVEFHHTQPHVWEALQTALHDAGFVIADVRTLDKQLGTFKQVTNPGAVKQDLIVSAFKPAEARGESTAIEPAPAGIVWEFIEKRLASLPLEPGKANDAGTHDERQAYLLFNRLVAELLKLGYAVPLSAPAFYAELSRRYRECDGRYYA